MCVISIYTGMYWYITRYTVFVSALTLQDTVVVDPPYPFSIEEDSDDVPLNDCWYACPQLFFRIEVQIYSASKGWKTAEESYRFGPDDLSYNLVFFSTFEELMLPIKGPMEDAGLKHRVATWLLPRT